MYNLNSSQDVIGAINLKRDERVRAWEEYIDQLLQYFAAQNLTINVGVDGRILVKKILEKLNMKPGLC
jgi:hypothetical protein